ncbi:hypothetical protein [Nocardioides stalactiti]|uniref:hypothetical protein n=1 Tax=Nocardioides stalactiti TaxID=2755356 RepID=UPI0016042A5C|nr:hypothetical protein [Nocardioides stalactiti]
MVGTLLVGRAWFQPADPAELADLDLPDLSPDPTWSCTVEYAHEERSEFRFGTFDDLMDWAVGAAAEELYVFTVSDREFHRFSVEDQQRLRSRYGRPST